MSRFTIRNDQLSFNVERDLHLTAKKSSFVREIGHAIGISTSDVEMKGSKGPRAVVVRGGRGGIFRGKNKNQVWPGTKRSADRCRYGRHKLDLQRDTRHAPAITTTVNDVSLLARRASSNLIALGQDVGTMRDKREGGSDAGRVGGGLGVVGGR